MKIINYNVYEFITISDGWLIFKSRPQQGKDVEIVLVQRAKCVFDKKHSIVIDATIERAAVDKQISRLMSYSQSITDVMKYHTCLPESSETNGLNLVKTERRSGAPKPASVLVNQINLGEENLKN